MSALSDTPASLDLRPLTNACARLAEGIVRAHAVPSDTQIRVGLIQRFEFTYELSARTLKRYLARVVANPAELDEMAFADVIRSANERHLLRGTWSDWKRYRDMRSRTSHTYDEAIAIEVMAGIPAFLAEAEHLLQNLRERNA